jgi:hypothetical protein
MAAIVARKEETNLPSELFVRRASEHEAFAMKASDAERVVLFVIAFGVFFGVFTSAVSPEYFRND